MQGSLTVPIPQFVNVLVYLEELFCANAKTHNCLAEVIKRIEISSIQELLMPIDILRKSIWRVCILFVKIRCYQYARKL